MKIFGCHFIMGVWGKVSRTQAMHRGNPWCFCTQWITVNEQWQQSQPNQEKTTTGSDYSGIKSRSWMPPSP